MSFRNIQLLDHPKYPGFFKVQAVRSPRSLVSAQSLLALVSIGVMFGSRRYILIVSSRRLVSAQSSVIKVPIGAMFGSRYYFLIVSPRSFVSAQSSGL